MMKGIVQTVELLYQHNLSNNLNIRILQHLVQLHILLLLQAPTIGMINCPTCGVSVRADSYYCKTCNTVLQRPGYIPPSAARADSVSTGLVILSIFVPLAGIILGIVRLSQGRRREAAVYGLIGAALIIINIITIFFSGWWYF